MSTEYITQFIARNEADINSIRLRNAEATLLVIGKELYKHHKIKPHRQIVLFSGMGGVSFEVEGRDIDTESYTNWHWHTCPLIETLKELESVLDWDTVSGYFPYKVLFNPEGFTILEN